MTCTNENISTFIYIVIIFHHLQQPRLLNIEKEEYIVYSVLKTPIYNVLEPTYRIENGSQ